MNITTECVVCGGGRGQAEACNCPPMSLGALQASAENKPTNTASIDLAHLDKLQRYADSCAPTALSSETLGALVALARRSLTSGAPAEPVDMILHCPKCGKQHVDTPEHAGVNHDDGSASIWDNPPHRSHLCHGCGNIWRPADVPTNGVKAITSKGANDSPVHDAAAPSVELVDLLKAIRPNYGAVGSRDVDVTAQRSRIDRAIELLLADAAAPSNEQALLADVLKLAETGMCLGLLADDYCSQIVAKIKGEAGAAAKTDQAPHGDPWTLGFEAGKRVGVHTATEQAGAAGAGSAQPRAEQVLYEYQPRHENGMLLDWTKLDVDTDEEARDYCAPRGFEWRRTIAGQSAQPRAEGDERTLKMRFVSTITAATSLGEQRVYDLAGSLIEVVRAALGQNAQAATAAGAGSSQLARQQQAAPHAPAGWQMVPEFLTESMHVAMVRAVMRSTGNDDCPPNAWAAALAAAPAAPHAQAAPVATVFVFEASAEADPVIESSTLPPGRHVLYAAPAPQEAEQMATTASAACVYCAGKGQVQTPIVPGGWAQCGECRGKGIAQAPSQDAPAAQEAEQAFAWAVFADNGNVIIWSRQRSTVEPAAAKYGKSVVPVIALRTDKASQEAEQAAPAAVTDAARDVLADAKGGA